MSSSIDELVKEIPIGQLAGRLGVSESEAEQAVRSATSSAGCWAVASGSDIADWPSDVARSGDI